MDNTQDIQQISSDTIAEGKNIATIAYLTFIGLIIAFVMNNEKKNAFATYHIRQSLGLMCSGLVLFIIAMIPILGWIIYIVGMIIFLVMWIAGLMSAINGKGKPLPILGKSYENWFKGIQ